MILGFSYDMLCSFYDMTKSPKSKSVAVPCSMLFMKLHDSKRPKSEMMPEATRGIAKAGTSTN